MFYACDGIWSNIFLARNGMSVYMTWIWPEYNRFFVYMTATSRLGLYSIYYPKRDGPGLFAILALHPSHLGPVISGDIWSNMTGNMTVIWRHILGTIGAPSQHFWNFTGCGVFDGKRHNMCNSKKIVTFFSGEGVVIEEIETKLWKCCWPPAINHGLKNPCLFSRLAITLSRWTWTSDGLHCNVQCNAGGSKWVSMHLVPRYWSYR